MTQSDLYSVRGRRLALLCHLVRWSAVGWITWTLAAIVMRWGDAGEFSRSYGRVIGRDLSALPAAQHAAALATVLLVWGIAAVLVVFVWRLFGHYLRGDIFSTAAATELQRLGWAGLACACADIVSRPVILGLITMHLGAGRIPFRLWAQPNDLLHVLMALFVVALATIFKAGVEIADDHRQFV
jgi:hypothetical protein